MICPNCNKEAIFKHLHDTAHGLGGTHMAGSERYVCTNCERSVYANQGAPLGFRFILDNEEK